MRIFKNLIFQKWAKKNQIDDLTLKQAITELNSGLFKANLGGKLYKKRISISNRGKNRGSRTIIAIEWQYRAFFHILFQQKSIGKYQN